MSGLGEALMQEGMEQGMQQGRELEILSSVKDGDYSPERGAQKLGCSLADFMKKMESALNV